MIEILQADVFARWIVGLRDLNERQRIVARIRRLSLGNPGDVRPIGRGLSKLRIDYGLGYPRLLRLAQNESGGSALRWR